MLNMYNQVLVAVALGIRSYAVFRWCPENWTVKLGQYH